MQATQIKLSPVSSGIVRSKNSFVASRRAPVAGRRSNVVLASTAADPYADKYPSWDSIYQQLNFKYGLKSVSVDEAAILIDQGKAVLLDIRLAEDYLESHPKGSVSVPAFRIIKADDGMGFTRMLKGLVMKANGVTPTEVRCFQKKKI